HPITGRDILFVNESFTRHVVGWSAADSRALLDELFAHLQDPAFRYRHSWQEGDYVLWDNAATQHLAVFDYDDLPRRLHRCGTDVVSDLPAPGREPRFVLAVVELDEGPRLLTNLVDVVPELAAVPPDLPVVLAFEDLGAVALPVFRPAGPVGPVGP